MLSTPQFETHQREQHTNAQQYLYRIKIANIVSSFIAFLSLLLWVIYSFIIKKLPSRTVNHTMLIILGISITAFWIGIGFYSQHDKNYMRREIQIFLHGLPWICFFIIFVFVHNPKVFLNLMRVWAIFHSIPYLIACISWMELFGPTNVRQEQRVLQSIAARNPMYSVSFEWVYPRQHRPGLDGRVIVVSIDTSSLKQAVDKLVLKTNWITDPSKLRIFNAEKEEIMELDIPLSTWSEYKASYYFYYPPANFTVKEYSPSNSVKIVFDQKQDPYGHDGNSVTVVAKTNSLRDVVQSLVEQLNQKDIRCDAQRIGLYPTTSTFPFCVSKHDINIDNIPSTMFSTNKFLHWDFVEDSENPQWHPSEFGHNPTLSYTGSHLMFD